MKTTALRTIVLALGLLIAPALSPADADSPRRGATPDAVRSETPIPFRMTFYYHAALRTVERGAPDSVDVVDQHGRYRLTIPRGSRTEAGGQWSLHMEGTGIATDARGEKLYIGYDQELLKEKGRYRVAAAADPRYRPFRTVAGDLGNKPWKDKRLGFKKGDRFFIKQLAGLELPDGTTHDGWVELNDTGSGMFGLHFDLFSETHEWAKLVAKRIARRTAELGLEPKRSQDGDVMVHVTFAGMERIPVGYRYGYERAPYDTGQKRYRYEAMTPPAWDAALAAKEDDDADAHDESCDDGDDCAADGDSPRPVRGPAFVATKDNVKSLELAQKSRKLAFCSAGGAKPCLDLSLFGTVDFSVFRERKLASVNTIVVHNGGYTAQMNNKLIIGKHQKGKRSGAHYTIQRDGTIYQHVGEEKKSAHANNANTTGVGIELNISKYNGTSCNFLKGKTPPEGIKEACAPTPAQYTALNLLIDDIVARTGAKRDKHHIIGHCEAEGATHGDPKAFDWSRIGLSNEEKKDQVQELKKTRSVPCRWYLPF